MIAYRFEKAGGTYGQIDRQADRRAGRQAGRQKNTYILCYLVCFFVVFYELMQIFSLFNTNMARTSAVLFLPLLSFLPPVPCILTRYLNYFLLLLISPQYHCKLLSDSFDIALSVHVCGTEHTFDNHPPPPPSLLSRTHRTQPHSFTVTDDSMRTVE